MTELVRKDFEQLNFLPTWETVQYDGEFKCSILVN